MSNKVNYLAELYDLNEINAENVNIDEKYGYTIKNNKGEWRNYEDPDAKSKALYMRWLEFFNKKMPEGEFEKIEQNRSFAIRATINKKTFYLSSDYIGPSKHYAAQAYRANNRDEHKEMADIFNVCRCFEGHIIWPKGQIIDNNHVYIPYGPSGKNTINMSRGGDKGVFDRIDVTLYLLKNITIFLLKRKIQIHNCLIGQETLLLLVTIKLMKRITLDCLIFFFRLNWLQIGLVFLMILILLLISSFYRISLRIVNFLHGRMEVK